MLTVNLRRASDSIVSDLLLIRSIYSLFNSFLVCCMNMYLVRDVTPSTANMQIKWENLELNFEHKPLRKLHCIVPA